MARKATRSRAAAIATMINSEIGSGILRLGNDPFFEVVRIPSGSLAIDRITGGGFALGRHIEIFGNECLSPDTLILMSDLSWRELGTIEVGEEIIAFDEEAPRGQGRTRRFKPSVVLSNPVSRKDCIEVTVDCGIKSVASEQHLWLVLNRTYNCPQWKATVELELGDEIIFFSEPWGKATDPVAAAYIAGLFDGEGYNKYGNSNKEYAALSFAMAQAENNYDILDEAACLLEELGYNITWRNVAVSAKHPEWQPKSEIVVKGGLAESLRFAYQINSVKLARDLQFLWNNRSISKRGRWAEPGGGYTVVTNLKHIGQHYVCETATTTKTLVANGLLSHNSSVKTTLCYMTMALSQQRGNECALIDPEHAFDPSWFRHCGGVPERLIVAQPEVAEEAIEAMMLLFQNEEIEVITVDSVAALSTKEEIRKAPNAETDVRIASQARFMSTNLRRLTTVNKRTLVLWINQNRTKIGQFFGNPTTQPGGRALKFYDTARIELIRGEKITTKGKKVNTKSKLVDSTVHKGYWVYAKAHKNKASREGLEATFAFDSENGKIDEISEIVQLGLHDGLIDGTERSFKYVDWDDYEWSASRSKFMQMITENDVLKEELIEQINDRTLELAYPRSRENGAGDSG